MPINRKICSGPIGHGAWFVSDDVFLFDEERGNSDEVSTSDFRRAQRAFIAERRAAVIFLYRQKVPVMQIAHQLRLPHATVSEDISWQLAQWQRMATADFELYVAEELASINRREMVAWQSFEKSCTPKKVAAVTKTHDPVRNELDATVSSATVAERCEGDPRFLAIIGRCTDQRMKLLGLAGKRDSEDVVKPKMTFSDWMAEFHRERAERAIRVGPMQLKEGRQ